MKTTLVVLAFLAGSLTAAPLPHASSSSDVALHHGASFSPEQHTSMIKRGDDADDAYHTITPHSKRGDDADDAYHTITPYSKRGDDADDAYHTITPHGQQAG